MLDEPLVFTQKHVCRKLQSWTCSAWTWRPGPGLSCKSSFIRHTYSGNLFVLQVWFLLLFIPAIYRPLLHSALCVFCFPPATSPSPAHLWAALCSPWRPFQITHSSYTEVSAQMETLLVSLSRRRSSSLHLFVVVLCLLVGVSLCGSLVCFVSLL